MYASYLYILSVDYVLLLLISSSESSVSVWSLHFLFVLLLRVVVSSHTFCWLLLMGKDGDILGLLLLLSSLLSSSLSFLLTELAECGDLLCGPLWGSSTVWSLCQDDGGFTRFCNLLDASDNKLVVRIMSWLLTVSGEATSSRLPDCVLPVAHCVIRSVVFEISYWYSDVVLSGTAGSASFSDLSFAIWRRYSWSRSSACLDEHGTSDSSW